MVMTDELSDHHFNRLARILEGHVGIRLPPGKRVMLEGRLRKRVRQLGLPNLNDYCTALFDHGEFENEFTHLVDLVTTNKTDFFREPDHFHYLAQEAVPQILGDGGDAGDRHIKLWSAACSIGAEPYTLAMVMDDLAPKLGGFSFSILGTDISTEVLDQAVRAVYPDHMMSTVPRDMLRRYVMQARDARRQEVRITPELRRTVRYKRLNLMDETFPLERDVDVIFCRNVLIYFDRPTQQGVLRRLAGHLRLGGYLFLGHAESLAGGAIPALRQVTTTVYRKIARGG